MLLLLKKQMHTPPFDITPAIVNLISEISEKIGALSVKKNLRLRKISKIKTLVGILKLKVLKLMKKRFQNYLKVKEY